MTSSKHDELGSLPTHVTQPTPPDEPQKTTAKLKVHWSRFKHIVSATTTASVSSESYFDGVDIGKRAASTAASNDWQYCPHPTRNSQNHRHWHRNTNPTISDGDEPRDSNADGPVDEVIVNSIMPSPYDSADKGSVTQPSSEHGLNERSDTVRFFNHDEKKNYMIYTC